MEKRLPLPWDLLVHAWFDLSSWAPPATVYREVDTVNNHVEFGPYRTTFGVAEVTVDEGHWSRQQDSTGWPGSSEGAAVTPTGRENEQSKPGFSGATGNTC